MKIAESIDKSINTLYNTMSHLGRVWNIFEVPTHLQREVGMTLLFGPIEFRCSHATSEVLFWVENEECFSWANFQDVILKVRT